MITYSRPNIIFMFGDDIGYNDVQFTSNDLSQASTDTATPYLNQLASKEGIIIDNYYVHRMCSPTRAAFLSGRYSFRYGMQTKLIEPDVKFSLTRQVSLLSEEFKSAGYATHAIGKWHLGFQSWEYTPTYRGFDTFYGYYNAWTDYYLSNYNIILEDEEYQYYDLRDNEEKVLLQGNNPRDYSMYRFRDRAIDIIDKAAQNEQPFFMYIAWQSSHTPSEAPQKYVNLYANTTEAATDDLRIFNQAQTTAMDEAINGVVEALKSNGLWKNTLLVFSSDNGGAATIGDNFPLRGYKKTIFEGGLRVPCFVSGGYLNENQRGKSIGEYGEYIHVTDWYPTLLEAAGIDEPTYSKSTKKQTMDVVPDWETAEYTIPLDGISIWNQIQHGVKNDKLSSRLMILDIMTDETSNIKNGSIRLGKWKYLKGLGTLDDYDGDDGYLWGDKFADISTDAHLWGQSYANLDIDNSLGCNIDEQPIHSMCFYTMDGCLFDLQTDPCEFNDVSSEFPEIFNYLKEHLQNLQMPTDVGMMTSLELDVDSTDVWLPGANGEFWRPWQDYGMTEFERVLWEDYNTLYGDLDLSGSDEEIVEDHLSAAMRLTVDTVTITSSCNDKKVDGLYYIKPTEHGSVIPVICSGGYTMLDASLNYSSLSTYFTSMYKYGDADRIIYGTDCGDSSGWRDWYIPANKNTLFRVAKDCNECEKGGIYGDNTAYYMTNGYFCPVELDIDGCSKSKDMTGQIVPDIMCNICDDLDGLCGSGEGRDGNMIHYDDMSWCDCYTLQLTSDHLTTISHKLYCQSDLNWRPNLMIDRSQCTCYKPLDNELKIYNNIKYDDLPILSSKYKNDILNNNNLYIDDLIIWDDDDNNNDINGDNIHLCKNKNIYLKNSDFKYGTYRIKECGNYILTENILINFNKPLIDFNYFNGDSPNSFEMDNLYWFPTNEQQESGEYIGLNTFYGPYSIGFIAAITIECNHVYINLNGFSINMDYEYYLQQRFFALIELGNKQFEARQGPVDFGRDDLCSRDIKIFDGTLGLSSHHGIHGSCAKNVEIRNLEIKNFDVTGIQCNGCKYMLIENCLIGPQNINIPVKGRYTHGRIILSRLRYLVNEYGEELIKFANRKNKEIKIKDLANNLIEQMDMIYYHIIDGIEFDDDNLLWIDAKKTFLNENGWMDGGSSYGILLNGFGTAVVNIGRRTTETYSISIKNVEIHNIKNKPYESFWAATPIKNDKTAIVHGFFFETIDWNTIYNKNNGEYIGDTYTDLLFAANKLLKNDFCPLGSLFYLDGLTKWVFTDKKNLFDKDIDLHFRCGSDIQSHSNKGAIGIRIDGVQDYSLQNIYIHNIVNSGDLGSNQCGEYEKITFEDGVDVDKDIQYGYTGTKVHGILTDYASGTIKNVKIEHLKSYHGSANAIALYKGSKVTLSGDISINQIIAGSQLTKSQVLKLILPNPPPFVCSIFIGPNSDYDTNPELTPVISTNYDFAVLATNLYGYDYCTTESRVGGMDDVNTPELLGKAVIIDGGIIFSFTYGTFRNSMILLAITVFVIIMIILCQTNNKFNNDKANKLDKHKNTKTVYGSFDS